MKAEEFLTAFSNPDHEYHALMAETNLNMAYVKSAYDFMQVVSPIMNFIEQKRGNFIYIFVNTII